MKASDIMTSPVITAGPRTPVSEIAALLFRNHISAVPIVDEGKLVGMVSEADLLLRHEIGTDRAERASSWWLRLFAEDRAAADYVKSHARKASDVMAHDVVSVAADTPVAEIAGLLATRGIKRVPVLRDGKLVGIVSRANLLRALASAFYQTKAPSLDDASIKSRLLEELNKLPWASPSLTNIIVQNGEVHLWGTLLDERQRQPLLVASENIPGVKAVHDHLVWVEPMTGMALASPEDQAKAATH